jgi:hypothetical protein
MIEICASSPVTRYRIYLSPRNDVADKSNDPRHHYLPAKEIKSNIFNVYLIIFYIHYFSKQFQELLYFKDLQFNPLYVVNSNGGQFEYHFCRWPLHTYTKPFFSTNGTNDHE